MDVVKREVSLKGHLLTHAFFARRDVELCFGFQNFLAWQFAKRWSA
jgi:hypothetical protein